MVKLKYYTVNQIENATPYGKVITVLFCPRFGLLETIETRTKQSRFASLRFVAVAFAIWATVDTRNEYLETKENLTKVCEDNSKNEESYETPRSDSPVKEISSQNEATNENDSVADDKINSVRFNV